MYRADRAPRRRLRPGQGESADRRSRAPARHPARRRLVGCWLAETLHDRVEPAVEVLVLDHERRREDQDVAVAAAASDEHPLLAQRALPRCRELGMRLARASIAHELEPEKETSAADVPDRGVLGELGLQARERVRA